MTPLFFCSFPSSHSIHRSPPSFALSVNLFSSWLAFDYLSLRSLEIRFPPPPPPLTIRSYYTYIYMYTHIHLGTISVCVSCWLDAAKCWCLPLVPMPLRRTFFIDTSYVQFFFSFSFFFFFFGFGTSVVEGPALLDIVEYFIYKLVVALFSLLLSRRRLGPLWRGGRRPKTRRRIEFKRKNRKYIPPPPFDPLFSYLPLKKFNSIESSRHHRWLASSFSSRGIVRTVGPCQARATWWVIFFSVFF